MSAGTTRGQLPPHVLAEPPSPDPDPAPQAPVPLAELATMYRRAPGGAVPPHRFALPHLEASASGPANPTAFVGPALEAAAAKLDLPALLAELGKTSGNTSYEEGEAGDLGPGGGEQRLDRPDGVHRTRNLPGLIRGPRMCRDRPAPTGRSRPGRPGSGCGPAAHPPYS